ncbi:MAG: dockerin type I repeat-containing protein [Candidatus Zixiibacteriota bacterium]
MKRRILFLIAAVACLTIAASLPAFADDMCTDVPGDVNNDGNVNILDADYLLQYLYSGGPAPVCPCQADLNGKPGINILDVSYLLNYLYGNGPAPVICTD